MPLAKTVPPLRARDRTLIVLPGSLQVES